MLEDLREQVLATAAEVAAAAEGLEIYDVALARGAGGWQLKVTLDRLTGVVSVGECAEVNVRLRARLELEGILAGDFALTVTSPGLDRALRSAADFERFRGRLAHVKVQARPGPEIIVGRIVASSSETVELETEEGRRRVPFRLLSAARLEPELPGYERPSGGPKRNRRPRRARTRQR